MSLFGKFNDRQSGKERPNKVYLGNSTLENIEILERQSIARAGYVTVPSVGLVVACILLIAARLLFASELVEWFTFQEMPRLEEAVRVLAGR